MTARLRGLVAVAILLALAGHPLMHPLLQECPCIHATSTEAGGRNETFILPLVTTPLEDNGVPAVASPAILAHVSRGPPA